MTVNMSSMWLTQHRQTKLNSAASPENVRLYNTVVALVYNITLCEQQNCIYQTGLTSILCFCVNVVCNSVFGATNTSTKSEEESKLTFPVFCPTSKPITFSHPPLQTFLSPKSLSGNFCTKGCNVTVNMSKQAQGTRKGTCDPGAPNRRSLMMMDV